MPQIYRAGRYLQTREGYAVFIPADLPPEPPVEVDSEMLVLLTEASAEIGALREVARTVPHPELFMVMYIKKEALLSSQIEGTEATLEDVLEFEAGDMSRDSAREVIRHVDAIQYGVNRLKDTPISLDLLKDIHAVLLKGVRGEDRNPGEFRNRQVVVGGIYYPPPPEGIEGPLLNLERFLQDRESLTHLFHSGVAHAQFETIHPFGDGNGRLGRLLITLLLCEREVLTTPVLYLSHYLLENRQKYYDRLMAIRNQGDWEGWLKFYLEGVKQVSKSAVHTAREIDTLRNEIEATLKGRTDFRPRDLQALDLFFRVPIMSVQQMADGVNCSYPTANSIFDKFVRIDIAEETTGKARGKRFKFRPYIDLFL